MSLMILIVIIASLCFSVGKGLRLTPFPVSAIELDEVNELQRDARSSNETAVYKYGPLDIPTQTQKRSKRRPIDFACPLSADSRQVITYRRVSSERDSDHIVSNLFVSRPPIEIAR